MSKAKASCSNKTAGLSALLIFFLFRRFFFLQRLLVVSKKKKRNTANPTRRLTCSTELFAAFLFFARGAEGRRAAAFRRRERLGESRRGPLSFRQGVALFEYVVMVCLSASSNSLVKKWMKRTEQKKRYVRQDGYLSMTLKRLTITISQTFPTLL